MAVEAKRGCGYRKVGGLYLVGGGIGIPCDRLPVLLETYSCCGQGIKQSRGWTWVDVAKLIGGPHQTMIPVNNFGGNWEGDVPAAPAVKLEPCNCKIVIRPTIEMECRFCHEPETMGKAGLLWIGGQFYPTPQDFIKEGVELGFSKRIRTVPRGFQPGETYVLLAHPKAVPVEEGTELFPEEKITVMKPGIFYVWLPQRIEKIMPESARDSEEIEDLRKRGITPVFVPDDDPDHKVSVYEKKEEEE